MQVSVGIENIKDIIADFEEALKVVPDEKEVAEGEASRSL
jgi:hypothetical protein